MRFEFKVHRQRQVRDALSQVFSGKCAYCESKLYFGPGDVEHYRPKSPVVESKGHEGYWWLASRWENLLLVCIDCNRPRQHGASISGKGNRFPLVNERNRAYVPGDEIMEQPLLLNPCVDKPEKWLIFDRDGSVASKHLRGQATIELLGLNRPSLVKARKSTAEKLLFLISLVNTMNSAQPRGVAAHAELEGALNQIQTHFAPEHEYSLLCKQIAAPFLRKMEKRSLTAGSETADVISRAEIVQAKQSLQSYQERLASYSLKNEKGREVYRSQRRLIETISISNIKAIRHLFLEISGDTVGGAPWMMLLGENSTGKSTVLQAVSIAIMGPGYFCELIEEHKISPADFLRYRCKSAKVQVKLSGFERPHTVIIEPGKVQFISPNGKTATVTCLKNGETRIVGEPWDGQVMLLGYGATRLLPRNNSTGKKPTFLRVENLFNPFVPLTDADAVLLKASEANFAAMALALKDLLSLPLDTPFIRDHGRVMVKLHGSLVSLRHLSDGYQSVVALAMDILEIGQRLWITLSNAEGIVLLDEIGTHLHPTWKMRIVASLRRALPGIQFIATTHEPLCLRGLEQGEVVVLKRDLEQQVIAVDQLPSPSDFRIDQLLTSEFFGLNSTVDEDVERDFDTYYALLAKEKKTPDEKYQLAELTTSLKGRRYLGVTLREQLMYQAIDQLIADGTLTRQLPRVALNRKAVNEISALWASAVAKPGEQQ